MPKTGKVFKGVAAVIWATGLVGGFVACAQPPGTFVTTLIVWGGAFIAGLLLFGFGELLEQVTAFRMRVEEQVEQLVSRLKPPHPPVRIEPLPPRDAEYRPDDPATGRYDQPPAAWQGTGEQPERL